MTRNPAPYLTQPDEGAGSPADGPGHRSGLGRTPCTDRRGKPGTVGRRAQGLGSIDDGWWKGELETNVTMDAEDLLLRQFLGIRTERQTAAAATWIRSRQREDGTWATYYGGPPDLSTTIEAYVALRLAGDSVDDPHMRRASTYIRQAGGIGASRVFTRIWLALFGQWPWESLPVMPPELMLLPPSVPLNIYDFGCWARQTVVALTVINAHRPVRELSVDIGELDVGPGSGHAPPAHHVGRTVRPSRPVPPRLRATTHRRPAPVLARRGRTLDPQAPGGGRFLGRHSATVGLLAHGACTCRAMPLDHPVMQAGLEGLDGFTIEDDAGRRIEACQSPVWDTALAVVALADAGVAPDDPVARAGGTLAVERGDHGPGGLDRTTSRPGPRRLGLRVRQRQLPRHRRHGGGGARPAADGRARRWSGGARRGLDRRHAVPGRRMGARLTSTTRGRSAVSCPSATSAS